MIDPVALISFDPRHGDAEIREIFADELARNLWLGIRQRNEPVNSNFNTFCIIYADYLKKIIKREGGQEYLTAEKLLWIISAGYETAGKGIIGRGELKFATELLPYVLGGKIIRFKIKSQ